MKVGDFGTVIIKLKVTYNLSHGLREIVYYQVGFSVVFYKIGTCHAVLHHLNIKGLSYLSIKYSERGKEIISYTTSRVKTGQSISYNRMSVKMSAATKYCTVFILHI